MSAPRSADRVSILLGGVAAFIAAGRFNLRPVEPTPATTRRVLTSLAVLIAMALTTFVPTWYTMTHTQF